MFDPSRLSVHEVGPGVVVARDGTPNDVGIVDPPQGQPVIVAQALRDA
jgi:hypothetical protein